MRGLAFLAELTHALYQHDAACRVIARLTRERDEARHALATMQLAHAVAAPQHADSGGMDVEVAAPAEAEDGMTDEVIAKLTKTAKTLSKQRKKRSKPAELATADQIKQMAQSKSQTGLHGSSAQITSMSLGNVTNGLLLTGGSDKKAVLFDTDAEKVIATMTGHKKKVTDVALHPSADVALTCSNDATVKVWTASAGAELQSVATHSADVTGISLHPTGDYFVSASSDRHWGFHSVETGQTLAYYTDESVTSGLTCAQVHPDGMIFATGTADNMVHVWDIKEQKKLTTFNDHSAPVTSVTFSENGYYMATASSDALIKLYDLRKIDNFHTIEMEAGNKINSISFDHSGSYLMAGGNDIRVYASKVRSRPLAQLVRDARVRCAAAVCAPFLPCTAWSAPRMHVRPCAAASFRCWRGSLPFGPFSPLACGRKSTSVRQKLTSVCVCVRAFAPAWLPLPAHQTWEHLKTLDSHKKAVTSVAFGQHAQSIFSTSADRSLKQYTF